ncbi:MAG: hypothetical protein KGI38_02370 [Thaumarchaeota archaeon]|nr:hypothetical protein [Nitrososphaerota archaeon]
MQPSRLGEKWPTGLKIVAALWLLQGILDAFDSSGFLLFPGPNLGFTILESLAFVLAVLQVAAAIGFGVRAKWSYWLGLAVPVLGLAVASYSAIFFAVGTVLGLDPVELIPFLVWFVWAVVAWTYLRRPYVKEYLGVSRAPTPS